MKQALMFVLLVVALMALLIVIVITLSLPANAHSEAELESWMIEYERMTTQAEVPPWPSLAGPIVLGWKALLIDMQHRHPCSKALKTWTEEACIVRGSSGGHSGMGSGVEQWRPLVVAYFPASEVGRALCVMAKESGGNPEAANPRSSARGLFQFLSGTWAATPYARMSVFDPEANIAAAAWLVAADGWHHWSPINRGEC